MANRVLRDWTGSKKINKCSPFAERFFTRLIMKVDDFGCYPADSVFLKSTLFPLIEELPSTEVATWLNECMVNGLVVVYEANGERYLQIVDFKQRLRQAKSRYPLPVDGQLSVNGRLETKRNEEETEEETKAACAELKPELRKKVNDLTEAICKYFSVKTIVTSKIYNSVCDYSTTLGHRNEMEMAAIALQKYMAYKARSQEQRHGVEKWIGTKENYYQDGVWITIDWDSKNKAYNGTGTSTKGTSGKISTEPYAGKRYDQEGF